MRSKVSLFAVLACIALLTTQCDKKKGETPTEEIPANPPASGINTVAEMIAANGSAVNTVTLDPSFANTLTINGNILEIPANAFQTSTGGTIAGIVSLQVKTINTKSQIIFSGAGANSSSCRLVATKGCVKATASQNTQSLRMNPAVTGSFFINVPDDITSPPPMKKYYAPKVTAVDSNVVWALGNDVSNITQRTFTTSSTVYHQASLDSLKWLNVGTLDTSGTYNSTAVTVSVTAGQFSRSNTMIFISFRNIMTVGALFETSTPGIFRINNVPVGKMVDIVAIAVKNGQYYCTIVPMTITSSSTPINLSLAPVSQATMKSMVAALL